MGEKSQVNTESEPNKAAGSTSSIWLGRARRVAVVVMVLFVCVFVWNLVLFPTTAKANLDIIRPQNNWTNQALLAAVQESGYTVEMLAYWHLAFIVLPALFYLAMAGIIFARRSADWFSLYVSVLFVIFGTVASSLARLVGTFHPVMGLLMSGFGNGGWIGLFPVFYLFPNGKFVPRWTWLMMALWLVFIGLLLVSMSGLVQGANVLVGWIGIPIAILIFVVAAAGQVYRYFRYSDAIHRQQTKWVLGAIVLFVILVAFSLGRIALWQAAPRFTADELKIDLGFDALFGVVGALFPVSIGIAILRYRLWDIDVIIRRTLTYAVVTALLAVVFFSSVILLEQIFSKLTGVGQNESVTVLSTLTIAALFVPLRNRVQGVIDRRFNRKRYDAQQVLNDFAKTVRDETDLETLTTRLMQVVNETMQPKSVSVWLKKMSEPQRRTKR